MTSPFECLPAELFDFVAHYLDLPEYQTIRLTSQRLHLLSLSTFTKKYFTKFITTLGSPSLDRLVLVANHTHLSRLVTTVEIRLLNHRDYKDLIKIARIGIFPPPKRFPRVSCVRNQDIVQESTLYDDVLANRQAKCITDRLARGLSGLENLKNVRIRAHKAEPLGWRKIAVPEGDEVFRSRCLRAVLDAIVKSGVSLESFIMGRELSREKGSSLSKCANVPYPAFQLPIEYTQRLGSNFATLSSMAISIVAQTGEHHRLPGWENGLSRFLSSAPALKNLTLSLDRKTHVSQYGARVVRSLSDATHLEHLQSFQLCNTTIHESDLAKFIKTHAETLQRLNFSNMCLLTGTWPILMSSFKTAKGLQYARLVDVEGTGNPLQSCGRGSRKFILDVDKDGRTIVELLDEVIGACLAVPVTMYA